MCGGEPLQPLLLLTETCNCPALLLRLGKPQSPHHPCHLSSLPPYGIKSPSKALINPGTPRETFNQFPLNFFPVSLLPPLRAKSFLPHSKAKENVPHSLLPNGTSEVCFSHSNHGINFPQIKSVARQVYFICLCLCSWEKSQSHNPPSFSHYNLPCLIATTSELIHKRFQIICLQMDQSYSLIGYKGDAFDGRLGTIYFSFLQHI